MLIMIIMLAGILVGLRFFPPKYNRINLRLQTICTALLIFAIPCVFLVLGYFLGKALGMGEMPSVGMAGLGLVVGFLPAVLVNRAVTRRQEPEFTILRQF